MTERARQTSLRWLLLGALVELLRVVLIAAGVLATIVVLDIPVMELGVARTLLGAAIAYLTAWLSWVSMTRGAGKHKHDYPD